jgi:hypothetical protein
MLLLMLMAWLPWLLLGSGVLLLGLRAVRAFERRSVASAETLALRDRVQQLEELVAEHGEELKRVADGQRFAERLLADRASNSTDAGGNSPPI